MKHQNQNQNQNQLLPQNLATLFALVGRNLRSYLRDRSSVCLSLLSALILLLIYLLFLGSLQVENLRGEMPAAPAAHITDFVNAWVFAGIVTITTFTTGIGALGVYLDDRVSGRFADFQVSPIRRVPLILGYQIAAVIIAVATSTVVMGVGVAMMYLLTGYAPSWVSLAQAFGLIALMSWAFAAISALILTFLRSTGAYTAVNTIVGTFIGFLAGAYLPIGVLSSTLGSVINALPFSWAAVLLREPLAGSALTTLTEGQPQAYDVIAHYYGFTVTLGAQPVPAYWLLLGLGLTAVLCTVLGSWRIGRTLK